MMNKKRKFLVTAAIALLFFVTNPTHSDYEESMNAKLNKITKREKALFKISDWVGTSELCRANYLFFSLYRGSYKSYVVAKEHPYYQIGVLGVFFDLNSINTTMEKLSYNDCEKISFVK